MGCGTGAAPGQVIGGPGNSGSGLEIDVGDYVCPDGCIRTLEGYCRCDNDPGSPTSANACPTNSEWVEFGQEDGTFVGGCQCSPGFITNKDSDTCDPCVWGTVTDFVWGVDVEACICNGEPAVTQPYDPYSLDPELDAALWERERALSPCECGRSDGRVWLADLNICMPKTGCAGQVIWEPCAVGCGGYTLIGDHVACVTEGDCRCYLNSECEFWPQDECASGERRACMSENGDAGWEVCVGCNWEGVCRGEI
jgi:hypothetical protein